ncbi:MAG: RNA polymerase factor sigma-54 [Candidatus Neomarinimicrobiota bacterium]|jgi:RNA polymerase sigma-54 factor|nr:RNA polymerase factor sigma-54 [Candidatus Neomarinimicrobiota bacterium]|tara:strand:- start:39 stop:1379 length:1341 start_codon:yes stop_codon:yes gene_type:complete
MPTLKQTQTQKQKLAPRQVLQAKLLQLNTVNLEQAILKELEQNPVLEQVEPEEPQEILEEENVVDDMDAPIEDIYTDASTYYFDQEKKDIPVPDRHSFLEDIIEQLQDSGLSDLEQEIAETILWNTNERGYLDTDLFLIADGFDLEENDIEPILKVVQQMHPKGLASRDLQECLTVQLEDEPESLSYKIVTECFQDFMHKRYEKIQSRLKCTTNELHEAVELISHLNPRPGEGYTDRFQTVIPDVIVQEDEDDWVITTNDGGLPELRISQIYEGGLNNGEYQGKAKTYIREKMDSANWFIRAVKQRRVTFVNVMRAIIQNQPEWFSGDMDFLRPLKLQDIANAIDMDISTISRSTRGKFADTPYGIFELKYFFTDAIELNDGRVLGTFVIKRALHKIIAMEDKQHPLSDDALVKKLKVDGYKLARRTVTKYRDQLGVPVARLRKEI